VVAYTFAEKIFGSEAIGDSSEKGRPSSQQQSFHRMSDEEKQFQKQVIEKEYVPLQDSHPAGGSLTYSFKSLAELAVDMKDLSDAAYFIDKCHE
jgi:hypothetical protein